MCGIVAMLSQYEPVSAEKLESLTARLTHRGPEVRRQWIAPHQRVGLGHARLSIIDLVSGNQPLSSEDNRIHAVVNGEFYGHKKIRTQLELQSHQFKTHSDSEILIHLYEEYGTSCLRHLRGEFAFALWDEPNNRLFIARDRFGIKPLYYAWHQRKLHIASEVKALFAAGVPASWDRESIFQNSYFVMPQSQTLFKGVKQVPAGHFMLASNGELLTRQYWDFNYPEGSPSALKSDKEYADEVAAATEDAIKVRLEADVPVACYLSGGLDSSAVLGMAARHSSKPVSAFALAFEGERYNEGPIAERSASAVESNLTLIPVSDRDIADNFEAAIAQSETLAFNSNGVAKFLLSRAVQSAGFKVVLTGEGADEVFGGYPHFKRDNLLCGKSASDAQLLLQKLQTNNSVYKGLEKASLSNEKLEQAVRLLGYSPSLWECTAGISITLQQLFSVDFSLEFSQQNPYRVFLNEIDVQGQMARRHPVNQSMYLWSKTWLPNYILSFLGDRMEMAHSLEGRLPFLDHQLVEKVVQYPIEQKIRGMTEKFVLREAARPFITEEVYSREKHPFAAPTMLRQNGPLKTLVEDTLRSSELDSIPFFDSCRVKRLLDTYSSFDTGRQCELDAVLSAVLSAVFLRRAFRL